MVKQSDPHFGESWSEWKDAVELGANFYDVEIRVAQSANFYILHRKIDDIYPF